MTVPSVSLNRQILALALPALATLITEPLLVIADSVIVGHLGTVPLAGLSIATNVVGVIVGLSIFLAYGTTAAVARRLGAGDRAGAIAGGLDGIALGAVLGGVLALALWLLAPIVVDLYGASAAVQEQATQYLQVVALALPGLLVTLASTGVLRGLQDTRTPLAVAIGVNLTNIALTLGFVHVWHFGLRGAALGTTLAATAGAVTLATAVVRAALREGTPLRLHPQRIWSTAKDARWLVLRAACLQATITMTTATAASLPETSLAAHQVTMTIWNAMAFLLDAFAIAAQALIGHRLGAGDVDGTRDVTRHVLLWGVGSGVAVGALLLLARPLVARMFTPDVAVHDLLAQVLPVLAVMIPLGSVVFILDGVLIGAGDMRYIGLVGLIVVAVYAPAVWGVWHFRLSLTWLWAAYSVAIAARAVTLWVRQRGTAWMRTGA